MNEMLDVARATVSLARRAGAEQCDAIAVRYDESQVSVRRGEVEKLIDAGSRSLGLRVITGGRTAVCSTSDFALGALEQFARDTVELARIAEPDEFAGLPGPALFAHSGASGLQLFDEHVESLSTDEKVRMARACEAAGLRADSRITNTDGSSLTTRSGEVALANSLGFEGAYPSTSVSLMVELMADDAEGKKRNAYWYSSERSLHRLQDPEEVGRIAARRAVDQLGARKVATAQVPVVFEPMMTASLLRDFASCASGSALYRGATFLKGREGEPLASALVTLTDDPSAPARSGSRPFDGEGVGSRATPLLEEGVFRGFLFDVYTARRTGATTTGSAQRGIESLPSPGPSNLVMQAGLTPARDIVADVREGLYVTALLGHGFNPTTGDYSRGVAGFWIRDGELAFPVTEINVSGFLPAMLAGVEAVGDDLAWFGAVAAPTIRVAHMTVSGL